MKSVYLRELQYYSKDYLIDLFGEIFHEKLLNMDIIKYDAVKSLYQFHYVGVIIIDDIVINCYPKYIHKAYNLRDDFKQVIKVIKKYDSSSDTLSYEDMEMENTSFNLLPMMLFFIEDYYENGSYRRIRNILEENGDGEVDWDKTVDNNIAFIIKDRPIYATLETKYNIDDFYDYFRLLHEYIVTECSRYLEKHDLLDLFDITPVDISENTIDDFGELDFILNKLQMEVNVEFNTRKQKLLHHMYSYLSNKNIFNEDYNLLLYGKKSYYDVWEKVCKQVFADKLDKKLSILDLPNTLNSKYNPDIELINVIKNPIWILRDKKPKKAETFIPDIVTIHDDDFIILDAKYYDLKFDKKDMGQPGLDSITKQYLYELAFREFIDDHGFNSVKNAFLFPTEKEEICNRGIVTLEILKSMGLEDIQVIMLPASKVYDYYIKNKTMNLNYLDLKV